MDTSLSNQFDRRWEWLLCNEREFPPFIASPMWKVKTKTKLTAHLTSFRIDAAVAQMKAWAEGHPRYKASKGEDGVYVML